MPSTISPQWRDKANGFISTSGVKLKQAGQTAGTFMGEVAKDAGGMAERVGSMAKSRWTLLQESRKSRPPGETMQDRLISAAATTGMFIRRGISETKEKVVVGKLLVEEAAKKTADKSKTILNNIERWQKGVASDDVFGVPIESTVQQQHYAGPVPLVLVKCADHLILSGLNSEFLFKSKGDRKVVRQLVSLFNQDWNASLPEGVSPIDAAALIKFYLASLPEPLCTFALYNEIRASRSSINDLRNILKKLPNVNYTTLEFITALLLRVSQKSSVNKMDARSLAMELAPIMMWQNDDSRSDFHNQFDYYMSNRPSKTTNLALDTTNWEILLDDDDDGHDVSSQIPLDDGASLDYSAIEAIQCLIDQHNAIFTDANETTWR